MQITKHKVVSIDYALTNDDGVLIDSSKDSQPLSYLHGVGGIIPGLEQALEGKGPGEELRVSIEPADAYGDRREELQQVVSRDRFADIQDLQVGMQFRVPTEEGSHLIMTVVSVAESEVTIDGNHPLAGVNLNFEVTVRDVRDATDEEISHGHAHTPDGPH